MLFAQYDRGTLLVSGDQILQYRIQRITLNDYVKER